MKHTSIVTSMALVFGLAAPLAAFADNHAKLPGRDSDAKRKSKNGKLEAKVGGADVVLTYGRPKVKGRKLFGDLVSFGKVWRTGADEATVISFEQPVMVEGKKLDAGVYALFTVPGEKEWTIIFNKEAKQWGAYKYDDSQDVLRVKVKPAAGKHTEALTFEADKSRIVMKWGSVAIPFAVAKS